MVSGSRETANEVIASVINLSGTNLIDTGSLDTAKIHIFLSMNSLGTIDNTLPFLITAASQMPLVLYFTSASNPGSMEQANVDSLIISSLFRYL